MAHLLHEPGIALGIGIVQRRVHLVEQAKRRRVEQKDRKHQRDRGERFFTARQQVDGGVFLARRLGHHHHAGVQNLVTRHLQPGHAAAKQAGEQAAKVLIHLVEGGAEQIAGFQVDLADRVFQRVHGVVQVGVLRVEKGFALNRCRQLVQRGQVDGTEPGDLFADAVDLTLQAPKFDAVGLDVGGQRGHVHLRGRELIQVLRAAQMRGLGFELQLGDLVAQRLQAALELHALLVGAAQLGGQIVVQAALRAECGFAIKFERQRGLQAGLGRRVVQGGQFFCPLRSGLGLGGGLLLRGLNGALQLGPPCAQLPGLKLRLLRPALQCPALLAGLGQRALGGDHGFVQLGMALLRGGQLHVQLVKPRFADGTPLVQALKLAIGLGQLGIELAAARLAGLGLLAQPQGFDLQLVGPGLGLGGVAAGAHQALGDVGAGGLDAHQRAARLVADEGLGALLAVQVLDLLGPGQQAGLLGIGCVESHREVADGMAVAGHQHLAVGQPAALGQCFVQAGRRVHAFQPISEQGFEAGRVVKSGVVAMLDLLAEVVAKVLAQPQLIGQARQAGAGGCRCRRGCRCGRRHRIARRQGVKRQPGRRGVGGKGAHRVDAAHRQRAQALTQHGLERGLPTRLDVEAGPQAAERVQPVARQPGLELALGLHPFLQGTQGRQARRQPGLLGALGIGRLLLGAALVFQCRGLGLQLVQPALGNGLGLVGGSALLAHIVDPLQIGRAEGAALGLQPLTPGLVVAALLVDVAAVRSQQLDLLLHLVDLAALRAGPRLGRAQRVLGVGQPHRLLFGLGRDDLGLLVGAGHLLANRFLLSHGGIVFFEPLRGLRLQIGQPLLHPLTAVHHVADALFEPAHVQRGLGQRALRRVQAVTGGVMGLAHALQPGLDAAQLGQPGFQRGHRRRHFVLHPGLLNGGVAVLQKPELVQFEAAGLLQAVVAGGHCGLLLQLVHAGVELTQDVVHPGQVLTGVFEPVLGLAAALFVLADAGRFFQEQAQFFGPGFDDAADRALADDGVGPRPQAGAQKHILHIAPAHRLVVDVVAAAAVAGQHPLDGDLGKRAPLATGAAVLVGKHQFDTGPTGRLALAAAVEDHVLHALATQLTGLALAQHPAHRIHDVGLAAAVGPDHAHPLAGQLEGGGLGK